MSNIIKVEPYTINQPNGKSIIIKGITGTMLKNITLNTPEKEATFHFSFLDDKGQKISELNASRGTIFPEIVEALMNAGMKEEAAKAEANTRVNQIISALGGGTDEQAYTAMSTFAQGYGYTLLPLAEQDGILIYPKETVTEITTI